MQAFVIPHPDIKLVTEPTADDLRAHVKSQIAGYRAPRSIQFVDATSTAG